MKKLETYAVLEGNMERLEKKLNTIRNKCEKYGCEFRFEKVGEEFRTIKDEAGIEHTAKFILVEAEGKAVINDWKFVASVEHTEKGNIINATGSDIEVPERYYTSEPVCEHCNSKRARKDTYIVMNTKTGEFKQVGKSCLKDFTGGMDASMVSKYYSFFDEIIKGEAPVAGLSYKYYYNTKEFLAYVYECIKAFGYAKTSENRPTRDRACDYWNVSKGHTIWMGNEEIRKYTDEMESVGFNPEAEGTMLAVEEVLGWVAEQEETSNYMHNLKTVCSLEHNPYKNLGILASVFATWNKNLEYKKEKQEKKESHHIGEVGERITIKMAEVICLTAWETQWGMTYMFKIIDDEGNVFTWKTSNYPEFDKFNTLKGTVKAHSEFRNEKQTELTRCKVA